MWIDDKSWAELGQDILSALREAPSKLSKLRSNLRALLGELTSILRRLRKSL